VSQPDYIEIPLHKQVNSDSCGAACEEMMIQAITGQDVAQLDLYNESQTYKTDTCWLVDPDGMTGVLNDRTSSAGKRFAPVADPNVDRISQQICWAIHGNGVAPAAAIQQGQHWVVVNGFVSDRPPSGPADNGFKVSTIDTVDPFSSEATPGQMGILSPFTSENVNYSYTEWGYEFTPVGCGKWLGLCVAVCPAAEAPAPSELLVPRSPRLYPGDNLLDLSLASDLAMKGLVESGPARHPAWSGALDAVSPQEPMLVHRLDRIDDFYFLVPLGRSASNVTAGIAIDGRYGHYRQATRLAEESAGAMPALTREAAFERIAGQRLSLPDGQGSILVRPEILTQFRTLGWRPCHESFSPFLPFYMFAMGAIPIYVRIDGAVFTSLTIKRQGA
jgi:hypothetical protein